MQEVVRNLAWDAMQRYQITRRSSEEVVNPIEDAQVVMSLRRETAHRSCVECVNNCLWR